MAVHLRHVALLLAALPACACVRSHRFDRADTTVVDGDPGSTGAIIEGVVIDRRTRKPARGAKVTLYWKRSRHTRSTRTDADGAFRFESLPDGFFEILVDHQDGQKFHHVDLVPGRRVRIRFTVHPNPRPEIER